MDVFTQATCVQTGVTGMESVLLALRAYLWELLPPQVCKFS